MRKIKNRYTGTDSGKFNAGTNDYFVRFTVQEVNTRNKDYIAKQLNSTYISEVKIYKADQSFFTPEIIPEGKRETVGSDDKLMRIIAKIKSDAENSSKIIDENGALLVFSHFTGDLNDFCIFENGHQNDIYHPGK